MHPPAQHLADRLPKASFESAGSGTKRLNGPGVFHARPRNVATLDKIHGELYIHRRFGALAEKFAVAEPGVAIAHHKESAAHEDRKIHRGSLIHAVVVHVAPVLPHRYRRDRLLARRSDTKASHIRMLR